MIFIAKHGGWFAGETEVQLLENFGNSTGLFRGYHGIELSEKICNFDDFIIEEDDSESGT